MATEPQLPPASGFAGVPKGRQTAELRRAGERERAEAKERSERARHDLARRRRIPFEGRPAGLQRPGERALRQFEPWALMPKISPGAITAFATTVPAGRVDRDDLSRVATIRCMCGESIEVSPERSTLCSCDRLFLDLGDQVRVVKTEPQEDDDG